MGYTAVKPMAGISERECPKKAKLIDELLNPKPPETPEPPKQEADADGAQS